MSDPTKPPPNPPGPWDHEDPPDGARPKSPKAPKRPAYKPGAEPKPWPSSQRSETPHKGATLGWLDEPAAPGDYAEIIRRAARDGDPIPAEMDDAGVSLDYDPVEACAVTFAQIIGEELYEDDAVEIDADEDLPSVTIGAFTFTISTTIRGGAARLARSLHVLGVALRHRATETFPCPDCVSEPCHACMAEEEE